MSVTLRDESNEPNEVIICYSNATVNILWFCGQKSH
jgi:hypothetical protein